jgi:hypothetical protein
MNRLSVVFIFTFFLFTFSKYSNAQHSEIGVSVTLSGHLIFGPYYRYWLDDNNEIDLMIPAAWEGTGKVLFPGGIQTGYHYYFGDKHWRPTVGLQYSLFLGPKTNNERKNLYIFTLTPGIQYRWDETKYSIEELFWISYFPKNTKRKISPTGFETRFGIKL